MKCLVCKKEFKVFPSRKDIRKFCSRICYYKSKIGYIPWNKGKKCPQISEAKIGDKNPMYGKKLTEEHRRKISEANKGENSYLWKGGITSRNKEIRNTIEFRLWREAVFSRDNWICQKCEEKGIYLHPHHILNFGQYPKLRFIIDNGKTLCKECHFEFHHKYGRKNNTKQQYIQFVS